MESDDGGVARGAWSSRCCDGVRGAGRWGGRRAWVECDDDAVAIVFVHAVDSVQEVVPAFAVVWAYAQACPGRHGEHKAQGRVAWVGVFGDVLVVVRS